MSTGRKLSISSCRACGGTALTWFVQNTVINGIQQGRLRTSDVRCALVLGCDSCSETLALVSADSMADYLNARTEVPA